MTSIIQPLDQGIIKNFKVKYREQFIRAAITNYDKNQSFDPNLWDAMRWTHTAWNAIAQSTIVNCFKHAGFVQLNDDATEEEEAEEDSSTDFFPALQPSLYAEATMRGMTGDGVTGMDFVDCDDQLLICSEEIGMEVATEEVVFSDDEEDESVPDEPPPFTLQQCHDAVLGMANYVAIDEKCPQSVNDAIATMMAYLQHRESAKVQTNIDKFFKTL